MKKLFFILSVVALLNAGTFAQNKNAEQTRAWKSFQTAIAKRDKKAIASMIEFPFEASIVSEDLNFRIETEADFLRTYDSIFKASRRRKIVSVASEDEFNFEILENGAYHVFIFRKIGKKYLLVRTMTAG